MFISDKEKKYSDFSNVQKMKNMIIPEEFPEGPFGSPINQEKLVEGKSTPWEKGQYSASAYTFPGKGIQRQVPDSYPDDEEDRK